MDRGADLAEDGPVEQFAGQPVVEIIVGKDADDAVQIEIGQKLAGSKDAIAVGIGILDWICLGRRVAEKSVGGNLHGFGVAQILSESTTRTKFADGAGDHPGKNADDSHHGQQLY